MSGYKNKRLKVEEEVSSDEEDYVSDDRSKTNDEETFFKDDLSNVPFKDMLDLQAKLGTKVFGATAFKNSKEKPINSSPVFAPIKHKYKPDEVSSKFRPKLNFRRLEEIPKFRDPRFDARAGEFNKRIFEQSYGFVDDIRKKEATKVRRLLKKVKNSEERQKMEKVLKSMDDREKSRQMKLEEYEKEKLRRKEERDKVLKGKAPFYLKKSIKKNMEKEEKMKELEESGRLTKYLRTREKKRLANEGRNVVNL